MNDSFVAINRLLKNGHEVYWLEDAAEVAGRKLGPGTIFVPEGAGTRPLLAKAAAGLGLTIQGVDQPSRGRGCAS